MATINMTTSSVGIDMSNLPYFYGYVTYSSPARITVTLGSQKQDYYGTFTFPNNNVAGTLNSTYYTNSSTGAQYSATGFSVDATAAMSYIDAGNLAPLIKSVLAGADFIYGSSKNDTLTGLDGNDYFSPGSGNDYIDGGSGIDRVAFSGTKTQSEISKQGTSIFVTRSGETDTLVNVERISFSDVSVAFDHTGNGGQAYRLYQAALGRTPDKAGLGFHINSLDNGLALTAVAQGFINSPEFASKYGALDNSQFVTQLYQNVLHRGPDGSGLSYHVGNLDAGMSRAQVLVGFSESPENQAALIGVIQNGMEYQI
jgi:serralysin